MKTEKDLFESWVKREHTHIFNGVEQGDNRFKMDIDFMFKAWQASANREGYKLVPIEATDSQWAAGIDAYTQAMDGQDILSASAFFDIYKAMIGAIE